MASRNYLPPAPIAYSLTDASRVSSLSQETLRRLIRSGRLEATKIGERVLVPRSALRRLVGDTDDAG